MRKKDRQKKASIFTDNPITNQIAQQMQEELNNMRAQYDRNHSLGLSYPPRYEYGAPSSQPTPALPRPGVEIEGLVDGKYYKVRLTTILTAETLADAKNKEALIAVELMEAVQNAAKEIVGRIVLEKIKNATKQADDFPISQAGKA